MTEELDLEQLTFLKGIEKDIKKQILSITFDFCDMIHFVLSDTENKTWFTEHSEADTIIIECSDIDVKSNTITLIFKKSDVCHNSFEIQNILIELGYIEKFKLDKKKWKDHFKSRGLI